MRRFNRFYTRRIGVLGESLHGSGFSLTEARLLFELAHRGEVPTTDLRRDLGLDAGYLSRMLAAFERQGLVLRYPAAGDRRRSVVKLTAAGDEAFEPLDRRARQEMGRLLQTLGAREQQRLVGAMRTIRHLLDDQPDEPATYLLRAHRPGDMGWVVHRHASLYAEEYGFDTSFEALVAEIVAEFVRGFDPARERCWIAEHGDTILGSVFLVRGGEGVAKLRLLLVEPEARGLGLGGRLVEECIRFARQCGYARLTLWTHDILHAARRIYERAGFRITERSAYHSFGRDLVSETWELEL